MKRKPDFSSMGEEGESERLLTTREVAQLLGVSADTLKDWRCRYPERGPDFVRVGGMIRYSPEDVRRYVRNRTVRPKQRTGVE